MTGPNPQGHPLRRVKSTLPWFLAYLLLMGLVIGGVFYARSQALAIYGSNEAQAQWDLWRDEAKKMADQPSPVKRRAPESAQPPALVLMRDHFAVCLGLSLVLSTVLFATFMFFLRGALQSNPPRTPGC
jgi:hypothetical protein